MPLTYAGRWGPEAFTNPAGLPLPGLSVNVYLRGTTTPAALFTDRTKAVAGPNPFVTDGSGNGTLFAVPGEYDLVIGGNQPLPITVEADPQDVIVSPTWPTDFPNAALSAGVGAPTDAEVPVGGGSLVSLIRRVRTLLNGGLPAALAPNGGLRVEQNPTGYNTPPGGPTFTLAGVGTFFTVDTSTMGRAISIQVIGNASANTVIWEGSNDGGATWTAFLLTRIDAALTLGNSSTSLLASWSGGVPFQQVRVRLSVFVGGTTTIAVYFHAFAPPNTTVSADTELPSAVSVPSSGNPNAPHAWAANIVKNVSTGNWNEWSSPSTDALDRNNVASVATLLFDGSGNTGWQRPRTPNIFKTVSASGGGSTALWTPTTGKKFRVMRYMLELTGDATMAAAGVAAIQLLDVAAGFGQTHQAYLPNAVPAAPLGHVFRTEWIDLGNGYLSAAANNVLNLNLSNALTNGVCRVLVCGTEE